MTRTWTFNTEDCDDVSVKYTDSFRTAGTGWNGKPTGDADVNNNTPVVIDAWARKYIDTGDGKLCDKNYLAYDDATNTMVLSATPQTWWITIEDW